MEHPVFEFVETALVIGVSSVPFQASSATSRSGAEKVSDDFSARQAKVLSALRRRPMTRQELVVAARLTINSVCSVVGALLSQQLIEESADVRIKVWPDGKTTKRRVLRVA